MRRTSRQDYTPGLVAVTSRKSSYIFLHVRKSWRWYSPSQRYRRENKFCHVTSTSLQKASERSSVTLQDQKLISGESPSLKDEARTFCAWMRGGCGAGEAGALRKARSRKAGLGVPPSFRQQNTSRPLPKVSHSLKNHTESKYGMRVKSRSSTYRSRVWASMDGQLEPDTSASLSSSSAKQKEKKKRSLSRF